MKTSAMVTRMPAVDKSTCKSGKASCAPSKEKRIASGPEEAKESIADEQKETLSGEQDKENADMKKRIGRQFKSRNAKIDVDEMAADIKRIKEKRKK